MHFAPGMDIARRFLAEVKRAQDRVLTPSRTGFAGNPKVDRFENIDFARSGPRTVFFVFGQHPDCRPGALTLRQAGTYLDPAIAPARLAARGQPRRCELAHDLRGWIGRAIAQGSWQSWTRCTLAPCGDDELAVLDHGIAAAVSVALALVVPAAPAIDVEAPFGPIDLGLVELVRPDEVPTIGRVFCRCRLCRQQSQQGHGRSDHAASAFAEEQYRAT